MKKNNFAEEYAREATIKAQYSTMRLKRQEIRKGRKLHGTPTMSWRSRSRQREMPTQESTGFTARHRSGATGTLI